MGLKINKILGYGLIDLETKGYEITDTRVNPEGFMGANYQHREERWSVSGFLEFWEKEISSVDLPITDFHLTKMAFDQKGKKPDELHYSVIHRTEYGDSKVLCVVPPSCRDRWHRHDDIIDYTEDTEVYEQQNRLITLPWGIWPWIGSFMDLNGEQYVGKNASIAMEFWRNEAWLRRNNRSRGKKAQMRKKAASYFAEALGFPSRDEAQQGVRPKIPEEVQVLCRYLNLFSNDKTIFQMWPMFYVFWS